MKDCKYFAREAWKEPTGISTAEGADEKMTLCQCHLFQSVEKCNTDCEDYEPGESIQPECKGSKIGRDFDKIH